MFPWNEPDVAAWNDATGLVERGWSLVPPELCMKHRGRLATAGADASHLPAREIQRLPPPAEGRELEPRVNVLAGRLDDTVIVGATDWDRGIALEGVAATAWDAVARFGTAAAAVEAVTATYDVDRATARRDVAALIEALMDAGAIVSRATQAATRA